LTALHLGSSLCLPACLPQLTQLKSFHFCNSENFSFIGYDAELVQVLPVLQHLTALQLHRLNRPLARALLTLPQLQSMCVTRSEPSMALPPGAWLAPLRNLLLPAGLLTASFPALEMAPQLELVGCQLDSQRAQRQMAELVHWAGTRPRLRWLLLGAADGPKPEVGEEQHVEEVQGQHPGLSVRVFSDTHAMVRQMALRAPELADLLSC
jgi:hypothetical protein